MKITTKNMQNGIKSDYELANRFKAYGYDKHYAWDMYVKWTNLKPNIDAKEFYELFESVPGLIADEYQTVEFVPTHFDNLCQQFVQIEKDSDGVYHLIWNDGTQGTNPPSYPPEGERFIKLSTNRKDIPWIKE